MDQYVKPLNWKKKKDKVASLKKYFRDRGGGEEDCSNRNYLLLEKYYECT